MFETFLIKVQGKLPPENVPLPPPQKIAPCPNPNPNPNPNPGSDLLVAIYPGGNFLFTFSKAANFCCEKTFFSVLTHLKPYLNEGILHIKILT